MYPNYRKGWKRLWRRCGVRLHRPRPPSINYMNPKLTKLDCGVIESDAIRVKVISCRILYVSLILIDSFVINFFPSRLSHPSPYYIQYSFFTHTYTPIHMHAQTSLSFIDFAQREDRELERKRKRELQIEEKRKSSKSRTKSEGRTPRWMDSEIAMLKTRRRW